MHACTLVYLHVHTQNTSIFACRSTMRGCTPAHVLAGVHTQNTSTCVPKAPAGVCTLNSKRKLRRAAELRDRTGGGEEEGKRKLGGALSSWLDTLEDQVQAAAVSTVPILPPGMSDCWDHPVILSYLNLSPPS